MFTKLKKLALFLTVLAIPSIAKSSGVYINGRTISTGTVGDIQVNLTTGSISSGKFGDNRVSITTGAVASGNWPDNSVQLTTGAIASGKFGDNRVSITTGALASGTWQDSQLTNTRTSSQTFVANTFSVGGSTFVVSGSSIGIGTSNPMAALDVSGTAQFGFGATKSTFTSAGSLVLDPAAVLLTGGASASNGTAIIRSTSTTAANPVLAVQNASGAELWQFTQAGNECLGGQLCATTMDIGGNSYTGGSLACPASGFDLTLKCAPNNIIFNTNSLERMRVANNGNVGIGTNAPGTTLDVNGGATIRGQSTFVSSATFRNANPSLEVGVLGVVNAVIDSPESLESFIDATNVYSASTFRWGKGSNGFGGGTELMRLQENGNLGIGTLTPNTMLDVNGGITARGTGNSTYSLITSSGISIGGPVVAIGAVQATLTGTGIYSIVSSSGIAIQNNGCLKFGDGTSQCTKAGAGGGTVTGSGHNQFAAYWDSSSDIAQASFQDNGTSTTFTAPVSLAASSVTIGGVSQPYGISTASCVVNSQQALLPNITNLTFGVATATLTITTNGGVVWIMWNIAAANNTNNDGEAISFLVDGKFPKNPAGGSFSTTPSASVLSQSFSPEQNTYYQSLTLPWYPVTGLSAGIHEFALTPAAVGGGVAFSNTSNPADIFCVREGP